MRNDIFWKALKELTPKTFITYSALDKLSDNEVGYCFASNKALAEKIGKNYKTISVDINLLKELGYIKFIEINKKGNYVEERRLYVDFDNFFRDKENEENLIKTTVKNINGILTFVNERMGIPENEDRGIPENEEGTISNNNLSNNNSLRDKFEMLIRQYKLKGLTAQQLILECKGKKEKIDKVENYMKYVSENNKGAGYIITAIRNDYEINKNEKETKKKRKYL